VLPFFARLPPYHIGIEVCGTPHHWARELIRLGREVRLMPPAYVMPHVKRAQLWEIDRALVALPRTDDVARCLARIPGIGPVGATALAASVTDPGQFRSGR
jgi:transposase